MSLKSVCIVTLLLLIFAQVTLAQEFTFGTDLIDGVESGRVRDGLATGYASFTIDGSRLTAVLRNTSPDDENFAGNQSNSPAFRRLDFHVNDVLGHQIELLDWQLTAFDESGSATVLGSHLGSSGETWRMTKRTDTRFRVKSRGGKSPKSPLYNPAASGGFPAGTKYFTDAVLVANFSANIGSADLNPELRYEHIGTPARSRTLQGVVISSVNPEPGSILIWTGLMAAAFSRSARRRRRR